MHTKPMSTAISTSGNGCHGAFGRASMRSARLGFGARGGTGGAVVFGRRRRLLLWRVTDSRRKPSPATSR